MSSLSTLPTMSSPNTISGRESAHEQPTIAEAALLPHPPQAATAPLAAGRLIAISQGKNVPTETHPALAKLDPVLSIDNFNLWYGAEANAAWHLDGDRPQ